MSGSTGPLDDKIVPSRELERKREWEHGTRGAGDNCVRRAKPIYTPPEKVPDECHRCTNDEWFSKGIVVREKETKKVVHREKQ